MPRHFFIADLFCLALLAAAMCLGCTETREESIERENGYLAEHPVEEVANYWRDVEYAKADGRSLTLDVSAPEGGGPFPVLMVIHGGGWTLHTNTIMEGMSRYIANRGYVVFNINYRTLPEGASMEEIVEDCMGALVWVKEHAADYKGDPERIAVTGDSAGGHLTAMIVTQAGNPAFTPTYQNADNDMAIACAVPTYGLYDFVALAKIAPPVIKDYMGESYKDNPERYKLLSPYYHIRKDLVPQLVMVGDLDFLYAENLKYVDALQEAGAPVELWVHGGQTHAFLNNYWEEKGVRGYDRMIEFLDRELKSNGGV